MAYIYQSLPEEQLLLISKYKTAKEVWDALKTRHVGVNRVQQAKQQTLKSEFEIILLNAVPDKFLQIVASIEQYSDLDEMSVDEEIGRLETFEERLKYKNERPVNTQEGVGSENLDGGVTESMSRPGIKEDIYAARTPIGRQSVGSITNQKHDQSGFMIDHNNEGDPNNCHRVNNHWQQKGFIPEGFVDPDHPEKVYLLRQALYGLKQAPRAWYDELSTFLMSKGFTKGTIDPTLFKIKYGDDILLVQIYVDDIIFGSKIPKYSKRFEKLMHSRFEMSLMREMKFFLASDPQVPKWFFINQAKPDLVQAVCYCARYQARPTQKHLKEVKRIFKYLKGTINMGLWYPKDSGFELTAFSDADHAGCLDTRKSTSGGIQFLGDKLVSWMSKKQNCTAMSSAEAEYVALSASCAQVMWMRTQLQDYGFNYNKIPLYCDSQSAIAISCNPVQHSRTKHIHTRYHFIKEQVENGIIELYFVRTEYQLADMFTKALPEDRFKYLVRRIGMRCLTPAELEVLTNETA
ncbi:retrovirus-related pol polyprotein from transposon TNT 1-94 [Tanacetum coccineum]